MPRFGTNRNLVREDRRQLQLLEQVMFVRVFEYTAAPGQQSLFEATYGPDGDWARLFSGAEGYLGTTLETDGSGTYRTQDSWSNRETFERFLDRNLQAYEDLGRRCASLKGSERHLGDFEEPMPITGTWQAIR